jgi:hypothetical protein
MVQAWITANAGSVGACYEIPGTSLTLSEPTITPVGTLSAKIGAWGGFACNPVTSTIYSTANGGHTDYSGNETNAIAMDVASPAWTMPRQPTVNALVTTAADRYLDGNPASAHGYYTHVFDNEGTDSRVIRFGGGSRWFDGGVIQTTDAYDTAATTWSALTTMTGLLAGFENPSVCRDPRNGNVYIAGSPSQWVMAKWTKSTNTWSDVRSAATTELSFAAARTAAAWDSTRNRIFFIGGSNAVKHVYTPDTNTDAAITLSGAAAAAVGGLFDAGLAYIPSGDFFLARDGGGTGGTFYKITPTGVCTVFATTGGSAIPTASGNQVYTRLVYVPALQSCVLLSNYANNLWLIRVELITPSITQQPQSTNVIVGTTATFTITATGATSYQWTKNGSNVGTNSPNYSFIATAADQRAAIVCTATNAEGSTVSNTAQLTLSWHDVYLYAMPEDIDQNDVRLRDVTQAGAVGGRVVAAADTISFTDSAVAVSTLVAEAFDTLTLTDSAVSFTNRISVASDSIILTDSAVAASSLVATASDSVTFGDSATAVSNYAAAASDTVSFSDSATAISSLVAAASDTLTLSDSAVSFTNRISVASDTLVLTDSAVAASSLVATASDTATFTDSGVASRGSGAHTATAADTVSFSDSAVARSTLVAAANDAVSFTDSALAASSLVAAGTDTLAFSDSAVSGRQRPAAAADTVSFADSATALSSLAASASDSLTLTDSATSFTNRISVAADTIAFSDSATAQSSLAATASDTVSFTDSAVAQRLTGVVIAVASDTIVFYDSAQGFTFTPPPSPGGGGMTFVAGGPDDADFYRARWRDEENARIAANNAFIMSLVGSLINGFEDEETP